jgi:hypothetical protein
MWTGKTAIAALPAVWSGANFGPHIVVFFVTGKMYCRLALRWQLVAESSIMLLNLVLPLIALRYAHRQQARLLQSFGWHWGGGRAIGIGLLGFGAYVNGIPHQRWPPSLDEKVAEYVPLVHPSAQEFR